ncbi:MAG: DinB family protein [Vicinamibacterales bacterium]
MRHQISIPLLTTLLLTTVLCAGIGTALYGQEFPRGGAPDNPAAAGNLTVAAQLNRQLSFVETEFVDAADAMPAEKYAFVPQAEFPNGNFRGVRTFAQQVLHVATANYGLYGAILPDESRPTPPAATAAKAEIMAYLRASFAFAHKATSTITPENMLTPVRRAPNAFAGTNLQLAVFGCSHVTDIYGQVVEYLRMNGLVPPATANQPARGGRGSRP